MGCNFYFFYSLSEICPSLRSELMLDGTDNLDINHVAARGLGGALCWKKRIPPTCPSLFLWSWEAGSLPWQGERAEEGNVNSNPFSLHGIMET